MMYGQGEGCLGEKGGRELTFELGGVSEELKLRAGRVRGGEDVRCGRVRRAQRRVGLDWIIIGLGA
jgi:hypothetical protein